MKSPKKIIYPTLLGIVLLLLGCANPDMAEPYAESFFAKIITKQNLEASKMIDSKSKLYPKRFQIIKNLRQDEYLGNLNSTGGGIWAKSKTTTTTLGYTSVSFPVKLNYDSTSIIVNVQVVDRGQGFKINKIEQ